MLKYEKIIRILSVEEKVELLTSDKAYRNRMIENYMLPEFKITTKSYDNNTEEFYPSFQSLGSTWNVELIEKLGFKIGKFNKTRTNGKIVGVPADLKGAEAKESFSSEAYLAGKMASFMLKGINSADALGCVVNLPENNYGNQSLYREELISYEMAIKEGKPYGVYCKGLDSLDLVKELNFINLSMIECSQPADIVKAFYNDCDLVIFENAKDVILAAIEKYKAAKIDLYYKRITKIEFDELQRNGEILNPDILDKKLDELLEKISLFDEKMIASECVDDNTQLNEQIASESVILLKNNGVLPLPLTTETYIVGEAIEKVRANGNVAKDSLLQVFEQSDIKVVGSAHGYSTDFIKNERLIEKAIKLSDESSAEVYIVFLYAPKNSFTLPKEQLDLIDKLYGKGKKIIAVVQTENVLDYSFINKCSAVIQTGLFGDKTISAICEVICGNLNPSAKTTDYIPVSLDVAVDKQDKNTYLYPLGYGLSYSSFDYSQLKVSREGLTFIIKNTSHYDGIEVPQVYVQYYDENHNSLYKKLKGFKKVFIKSGESVKVSIPFDEFTFRTYNEELQCYEIKAGRYSVSISKSADNIALLCELSLDGKVYDINGFKIDDITAKDDATTLNGFLKFKDRKEGKAVERGIALWKKILISTIIAVYYNTIMIPLFISSLEDEQLILSIIVGALTLAANVYYVIYLIKSIKHRKRKEPKIFNDTASLVLSQLKDYSEVAKVTYPKPIPPTPEGIELDENGDEIEMVEETPVEEEVVEEEVVEEQPEEEEQQPTVEYDLGVDPSYLATDVQYDNGLEIEQWVKQFVEYASSKGLIIEHKSARALLAAIASSRLVIINSVSKELLPLAQQILFEFVDSKYEPISYSSVSEYKDLIWTLTDEKYVCSNLVHSLYRAKALNNHISLCAIENVDFNTFEEKFDKLFNYFSSREDNIVINLGKETEVLEFVVPKNMVFIATANNDNYLETLPKNVAECSVSIELALRNNEIIDSEAKVSFGYMSFNRLNELMKNAKEINYIYEKQWKKFDDVEEQINELSPFSIHNKTVLCFENLAAFILSCGVEIDEFIDLALACRIVPCLKSLKAYQATNGDSNLYGIITKIFGEDSVPQTKRSLTKPLQ